MRGSDLGRARKGCAKYKAGKGEHLLVSEDPPVCDAASTPGALLTCHWESSLQLGNVGGLQ